MNESDDQREKDLDAQIAKSKMALLILVLFMVLVEFVRLFIEQ